MPRKKKQRDPEYALHVFHHLDERTRTTLQVFLVETIKEFTNFNYEILLDVSMQEKEIYLKILGLRTTPLTMPGVGPARGRWEFTGLHGSYQLSVIKLDGETNQFQIDVTRSTVTVKGLSPHPFMTVSAKPTTLAGI